MPAFVSVRLSWLRGWLARAAARGRGPAGMTAAERALLAAHGDGALPALLLRTGTTVDVGQWLARGRIWLCGGGEELVLLAAGKVPYVELIARAALRGSLYNPVTGELVLAPADGLRQRRLSVPPVEGYRALQWLGGQASADVKQER
jgi:hypothetical protein